MAPPRVWKLLEAVGCEDVYEFLAVDRQASLADLRAAAEKKYVSIHNQSSRNDVARAGQELAGLCKSKVFKDVGSKKAYDDEARARARRDDGDRGGGGRRSGLGARGVLAAGAIGVVALAVAGIAPFLFRLGEGIAELPAGRSGQSPSSVAANEGEAGAEGSVRSDPEVAQGETGDARGAVGSSEAAGGAAAEAGRSRNGARAGGDPSEVEDALGLDRPTRRRIQAGLSAAGFAPGPADGVFGVGTREAISRWQAARGGAATGYLSAMQAGELSALGAAGSREPEIAERANGAASRTRGGSRGPTDAVSAVARVGAGGGTLTVRSAPASRIEMDGADVGATGASGVLVLSDVLPGRHVVVARKEGHTDASSVVSVAAGRAEVVELALTALPGTLTVTANVGDAVLQVGNAGEHRLPLSGLELPAGSHRVTAVRDGFLTLANDVEIRPGALTTLDLVLEPVPVGQLLQVAVGQFAAGNYRAAAESTRSVVRMRPEAGEAHRLLGTALYELGDFENSIGPLSQAIRLGQEVVLATKHRHGGGGLREGFCSGTLALSRNTITFVSGDQPDHGFSVAPARMTAAQITQSFGRSAFRVNTSVADEDRERRRSFDFVHRNAERTRRERDSLFLVLTCPDCDRSMNVQAALMNYVLQLSQ